MRSFHGGNPEDFEYFNTVKSMFVSRFKGGVLLNCDFTSLEIYIAALVSKDQGMVQILLDNKDYHEMTARKAFNIPEDQPCPPEDRQNSKKINFGILYSMSSAGLADTLGESQVEAQRLLDAVLNSKPGLKKAIEDTEIFAKRYKYVENLAGFRRRLSGVSSKSRSIASRANRQAFNAKIQSAGAYCTNTAVNSLRIAMYKLHMKSKIAVTVHDSILVDAHPDEVDRIAYLVKYVMENMEIPFLFTMSQKGFNVPDKYKLPNGNFRFPLRAELEIGTSYGTMTDYDPQEMKKYPTAYDYAKDSWDKKVEKDIENHKK